jgi:hypothetical protein
MSLGTACGGGDSGPPPIDATPIDVPFVECPTTGRYLPLAEGSTWTFRVTDQNAIVTTKTQTVGAIEDVGGAKAGTSGYRVTTTKPTGMTISWQEDVGDKLLRHREHDMAGSTQTDEIYTPFKLRLDETSAHLLVGATWDETYVESVTEMGTTLDATKVETWSVIADDELVQVPAGNFCTLRIRRTSTVGGSAGSDKTYWYARGVGKVKEVGGNQTEELLSYTSN